MRKGRPTPWAPLSTRMRGNGQLELDIMSAPRQEKSGSAAYCTAIFTRSSAYRLAWCPQNTSSPPPARVKRSFPAALQRSHRSSAAGPATLPAGGVRVGVIAFLLWSSPMNLFLGYYCSPIVQHPCSLRPSLCAPGGPKSHVVRQVCRPTRVPRQRSRGHNGLITTRRCTGGDQYDTNG